VASGAIGLVLARPTRLFGVEPFFMELIGGLEETFVERGLSILLHVVPTQAEEIAAYRRWAAGGVAEAVIVPNLVADDPRPAVLTELGLPAVLVGSWQGPGAFSTVRAHDAEPVQDAAARLLALGHRRIARVTGPRNLLHTQARSAALVEACAPHGVVPVIVEGDYTERSGADLTETLLRSPEPPTAIVYDNDLMAIGGLRVAEELGVDVPGRLSVVAWDDSTLCRLATPPLTVLALDVHQYGITVAEAVLDVLDGKPPVERWAPPSRWLERASTGPAPAAGA
jgi:DNA-binding LacI/PurR family transcriptional regulator